jgi:hypothetical protein
VGSPGSGRGSLSPSPGHRIGESSGGTPGFGGTEERISTYDVLRYIKSTFDEEEILDKVPLEAAGNPGAWHAWRTHRIKIGAIPPPPTIPESSKEKSMWHDGLSEDEESIGVPEGYQRLAGGTSAPLAARRPGEWNWEGVWEVRVKKGIDASLAEAVLFGSSAGDDLIRFLNMDGEEVENIKENIMGSLETVDPQRKGIV